jgi:CheY-like chemotaxis protein
MAPTTPPGDACLNLRHELVGSIHTLVGAVELLLTTRLTARQLRYVNVCKRSAERLITLSRKVSARAEERSFERMVIDDLAKLGVMHLPKPVTRTQLIAAVRSVGGTRRLNILAADDSPDSCALVAQFLKRTAKRVDIVNDGLSAFQKYQQGKYDLLIIDLDMPVMDGRTAMHRIRVWEAEHHRRHIPIIVLTARELIRQESGLARSAAESDRDEDGFVHEPYQEGAHLVP